MIHYVYRKKYRRKRGEKIMAKVKELEFSTKITLKNNQDYFGAEYKEVVVVEDKDNLKEVIEEVTSRVVKEVMKVHSDKLGTV